MQALLVAGTVLVACSSTPNPLYCDENTDCDVGTTCNLDTHGCEPSDAAVPDMAIDAFVARSVQEVRSDQTPDGTLVELTNVIVTGVDLVGANVGTLWVQQPGGGMGSGIFIFGAVASEVALLEFGDVIDVVGGRKQHYTAPNDFSGRSLVEISAQSGVIAITLKGTTATPIATEINVFGIGQMTPSEIDVELSKLAGTYVRAQFVKATSAVTSLLGDGAISIGPLYIRAGLADLPPGTMMDTCFSSIRGVLDYAREYSIQPQFTSEMVIGSGCL